MLNTVALLFEIYWYILIARIIMSWVPSLQHTGFGEVIYKLTEPYLSMFRGFIPPLSLGGGYLDLSPIIAFIAFYFIRIGTLSILGWILLNIGL
ncbi:hypothetical protein BHF68_10000 [Desulfuribacillus alkaliarsenatis]|uniref:Cell division protein n=1 Tax=Desulfuribacillus alkaliarsenatis TaxID=766136 RepID=A0A1E5G015_9FIRM|nr:hypothetical protein BHF68_10000 [Desulfuribacillus alkaliarsenatis]